MALVLLTYNEKNILFLKKFLLLINLAIIFKHICKDYLKNKKIKKSLNIRAQQLYMYFSFSFCGAKRFEIKAMFAWTILF
jgi:hypothetical protein